MQLTGNQIPAQMIDRFCVAGINYHKADATVRGLFAVNKDGFSQIAAAAKASGIRSVFVLSTCNRTEIYGFAENVMLLVNLLSSQTNGSKENFLKYGFLKSGDAALNHLYSVAAGLDSQILGDYEILGQLKQAIDLSTQFDLIGPVMNRTVNFVLQASKKIKTETALSSGTVSVSYAAIELLKDMPGIEEKKILVIGAGKFGRNVCKNLKQYLPASSIVVINRTNEVAKELADIAGVGYAEFETLPTCVAESDVVIVCTNAQHHTIIPAHFTNDNAKLVLDLSVPVNVHPDVKQLQNVRVIDVDEISTTILDKTLSVRKAEVPRAENIILQYKKDFYHWASEYRYSLHIKSWKDKLQGLQEWHPTFTTVSTDMNILSENRAQKAVTKLAVNLRTNHEKGCLFINAINDYLQMS